MNIKFSTNGQIRDALGKDELLLEVPEQVGLTDIALQVATGLDASVRKLFLDENDQLQPGLLLIINDEMVFEGEDNPINAGDHISIMLPMSGG